MSTSTHLEPGAVFAKDFRVVKPLREGGMGAVYVVEQISTGRQRALKVMVPSLVDNPDVRERFEREAKVAANIESDHIVETVTAGVDEASGSPYLVMELLRGEELADAVERTGPLPLGDVLEILSQVGHALEQAHARGVVHRDLKPENIFLASSKRRDAAFTAKVLDFGIAKLVMDGMQKTGTQPLGSPLYMAPEQTDRKGKICPATDVWALGLIAFYLLTGRSYWKEADDGSLPGLLREICVDPIASASERAAEKGVAEKLPPKFDAWFAKCVDRDVDARFTEAGEAVRAFTAMVGSITLIRKLEVATGAIEAVTPAPSTGSIAHEKTVLAGAGGKTTGVGGESASQPLDTSSKPPSSGRGALYGLVGLAALGGAGGVYMLTVGPRHDAGAAASSTSSGAVTSAQPGPSAASASAAPSASGPCPAGMIFHPAGKTIVGSKSLPDHARAKVSGERKVDLSAFCLDGTEVTVRAYEACVADNASCARTPDDVNYRMGNDERRKKLIGFCNARKPARLDHPINCVDFTMAQSFCKWRKARLPTEAEWEYAARGSGQHDYPWGDEPPDPTRLNAAGTEHAAWDKENGGDGKTMFDGDDKWVGTAPVGSFPAGRSQFGVSDLAGNVWEWTADYFGPYEPGEHKDPTGPAAGEERVIRGGAFNGWDPQWANPAWRYHYPEDVYSHALGFRCAAPVAVSP